MQRRGVIEPEQPVNYALLSLFQYIASVLVIMVHCQRLFEHETLHFVQKSMFGRMAVPFFLISSAYFFRVRWKQEPQDVKLTLYIKGILKVYGFWSLVYLPYALTYFQSLHLPLYLAPLAILAARFYIGMSYQLWGTFPPYSQVCCWSFFCIGGWVPRKHLFFYYFSML